MNWHTSAAEKATAKLQNGMALAEEAGEEIATKTERALRATERQASDTLGRIASSVEDLRRNLPLAIRRAADEARGAGRMTAGYVRDEPVKSALIAAAAGALLIGVITAFSRRRS